MNRLDRRDVVAALLEDRGEAAVVCGLGAPSYDAYAAGDSERNFYLWGAMGSAAALGLGLALAQPSRRVVVLTGDGEMMMGLGSLATIAARGPENLAIVVLDNETFGETGGQPGLTRGPTDLADLALAAGFPRALTARGEGDVSGLTEAVLSARGPVMGVVKVRAGEGSVSLPPRDGPRLHERFREALTPR